MSSPGDYDAVRKDIIAAIPRPGYDDGSLGPIFVRLAWHASGNYSLITHTGGSNGAGMRFPPESIDPANAGLVNAINYLQPIKDKHSWISHSDLWTLAGVTAIKHAGGPVVPWTPGRTDYSDAQAASAHRGGEEGVANRLPDGAQGAAHLRDVFGRMGFSDQEIVALCGAHVLGRCHSDRSGFDGPWVTNPTRFSNQYYRLLLQLPWQPRAWDGPRQFAAKAVGKDLMMLPSDMSLLDDDEFRKWVELYAKDKDRFYDDFAAAFAKLLELGVDRSPDGYAHLLARASSKGLSADDAAKLAPRGAFSDDGHKVVTQLPGGAGGGGCPFSGKSSRL